MFKEDTELLKKGLNNVSEDQFQVVKAEMLPFDAKYENTDEKGGKKIEKKKNDLDVEEEDGFNQYSNFNSHSHFGGGRGGGFGGGRGNVVYCTNQ